MKRLAVLMVVCCVGAIEGSAAFKMPKSVYRMDQLEEAKNEARDQGLPITFIYTREQTSCGLAAGASLNAAKELKRKTIVVYANCDVDNEWYQLPEPVQEALRKPESGRFVPKTVIVDPEITHVIAIVPYARGSDYHKLLKQAKKAIPKVEPKSTSVPVAAPHGAALPAVHLNEDRETRIWTSKSGAELTASLLKESAPYLILKKEDGNHVQILLSQLSDEDQQYVFEVKNRIQESGQQDAVAASGRPGR